MGMMKSWFVVIGFATLLMTVGCGKQAPNAPSEMAVEVSSPEATMATTATATVVTLQADLTANPSLVTVAAGAKVQFVDNSGRFVTIHSYNCNEFSQIRLNPGTSKSTMVFWPAGKTCDYFAWDTDWARQIFQGHVTVR